MSFNHKDKIMRLIKVVILFIVCFAFIINSWSQKIDKNYLKKYRECWDSKDKITLLDTVKQAMHKNKIEEHYRRHDFIQTFGCAYEEDDIEQNSIRAIYRAVIQSIRNRNIELRDDLTAKLKATPPRPDNLMREYSIYVNIPLSSGKKAARYEIKILDLVAVPTIESSMSVWSRIVTRFAYKEDFNKIQKLSYNESEFVQIMEKAQTILEEIERKKFSSVEKLLNMKSIAEVYPAKIADLSFGDSMHLFDEKNIEKTYLGIFLGKGIIACKTPKDGIVVCKFGEERLFSIRIDTNTFRRTTTLFAELNYQAPEVILQCLFLKFSAKKPHTLPPLSDHH